MKTEGDTYEATSILKSYTGIEEIKDWHGQNRTPVQNNILLLQHHILVLGKGKLISLVYNFANNGIQFLSILVKVHFQRFGQALDRN